MSEARKPRNRRGKTALIDPGQVRHLVAEGMTRVALAEHFDVSTNAIDGICRDFGISGRPVKYKAKPKATDRTDPGHVPAVPLVPTRESELRATGGRYADLRAWAQRWGVTEVKARQEWHALRLPVAKGGTE